MDLWQMNSEAVTKTRQRAQFTISSHFSRRKKVVPMNSFAKTCLLPKWSPTASRRTAVALAICLLTVLSCRGLLAQQRPLQTQDPAVIPPGDVSLEFGFDFLQNANYPLSGLTGDLTSVGVIGIHVGLGEIVEFQMEGTAYNFLSINERSATPLNLELNSSGTAASDFGDLIFSTKISIVPERKRTPSFSFRPSVQLPNASTAKGLGLDSTQFYGSLLMGKHFGKLNTFGNVGLGILSNPVQAGVQNDLLIYGIAAIYPVAQNVNLAGEVFGRWNSRKHSVPLGTENQSQLRIGLQIQGLGFRWDVAAIAGLADTSADSGITFGITKQFQAFKIPTKKK